MPKAFLDKTYSLTSGEETRAHYDAWAKSYDEELHNNGYATPVRIAKAMAEHCKDPDIRLLDYGCGTGLSGEALQLAGFNDIDGMDPSEEMIAVARGKGVYRSLSTFNPAEPSPIAASAYGAITCIGVIGVGAAPPETFDLVMDALPKGGILGYSLNDHALANPDYEGRLDHWTESNRAKVLFKEYGVHLPGQNLFSNVYIVEKT